MVGIVSEQSPQYKMLVELGGRGYNTGVMLMWLERMRRSQLYQRVVAGFASQQLPRRLASGPTLEELGWNWFRGKPNNRTLGWVADQTLYSWMSVPGEPRLSAD